ncbi:MAG: hypothetical protein ACKESC_01375 [Candidatus Hodgkinia cicadicola]
MLKSECSRYEQRKHNNTDQIDIGRSAWCQHVFIKFAFLLAISQWDKMHLTHKKNHVNTLGFVVHTNHKEWILGMAVV